MDEFGAESEWSDSLLVSMPKTKTIIRLFLTFLENHPHLFPLLRQILANMSQEERVEGNIIKKM